MNVVATFTEYSRMASLRRHQRAHRRQWRCRRHRTSIMCKNTHFIITCHMLVINAFRQTKYSTHPSLSDAYSSFEWYFYGFNMILSKLAQLTTTRASTAKCPIYIPAQSMYESSVTNRLSIYGYLFFFHLHSAKARSVHAILLLPINTSLSGWSDDDIWS